MKTATIVCFLFLLLFVLSSCSISSSTEAMNYEDSLSCGKWTLSHLNPDSKELSIFSDCSSSTDYLKATRSFYISSIGTECCLTMYGEASVLGDKVKDPYFSLLNIEDPENGISYHESIDPNDSSVVKYRDSIKYTIPPDYPSHKRSCIAFKISGIQDKIEKNNNNNVSRIIGLVGFDNANMFSSGSGGYFTMNWGWLFWGLSTGTGIYNSTPNGVVSTSIKHQAVWGGSWVTGAKASKINIDDGQITLYDDPWGWWNYLARWDVVTAGTVIFGFSI
jgi:hypothetical protein